MATEMTRIAQMSETERSLVNTLSPAERKTALVEAATSGVRRLLAAHEAGKRLIAAHDTYAADEAAYDAAWPLTLHNILSDRPAPPVMRPEAHAGQLIKEHGGLTQAIHCAARVLAETDTSQAHNQDTIRRWQDTLSVLLAEQTVHEVW